MLGKAYLALGCFWGPEEHFGSLPGILKTRVGYSGGMEDNPTYHNLDGHSETVELEFDPKIITYQKILEHFFLEHDPQVPEINQYRSVIFYLNEAQKNLAERAKAEAEKNLGSPVLTAIEPLKIFFPAEEYHQKYFAKLKKEK